jgi:hypothetical protein
MPYALLEVVFPPIKMSGCPVRMTVMVTLAAGLICAVGLDRLLGGERRHRIVAALFAAVLVFEYWPRPMPVNPMPTPGYVRFLSSLPKDRAIIDRAASPGRALYFQTVHRMPMALGYISRVPESLHQRERPLVRAAEREDSARLRSEYDVHYFVKTDGRRTMVFDTATGVMVFPPTWESKTAVPKIDVKLRLVEVARVADRWKVLLEVRFTNVGGGIFELDKVTACEGGRVQNHVFDVRDGDTEIDYRGMMTKRAPPGPEGFHGIAAGQSVAVTVDIGAHYDLPASGQLRVRFDHHNHFSKQSVQLTSNEVVVTLP